MKLYADGVPCTQHELPTIADHCMTPETLAEIMEQHDQGIFPVAGDCLGAAQVEDGGWVAVDFTRRPAPPRYKSRGGDGSFDLCMCLSAQERSRTMFKSYDGKFGPMHMVSTRYADQWAGGDYRMNFSIQAVEIYGVIFASWSREGKLLWQRDPAEFPEHLPDRSTIHGENVGMPMQSGSLHRRKEATA